MYNDDDYDREPLGRKGCLTWLVLAALSISMIVFAARGLYRMWTT